MNKEEAISKVKNIILEEINKYEQSKQKKKAGRPLKLTHMECLNAIFLCPRRW